MNKESRKECILQSLNDLKQIKNLRKAENYLNKVEEEMKFDEDFMNDTMLDIDKMEQIGSSGAPSNIYNSPQYRKEQLMTPDWYMLTDRAN